MLSIKDLSVSYHSLEDDGDTIHALSNISLELGQGESLGIVGESGCGKTTFVQGVLRLLPDNGTVTQGTVEYRDTDLYACSEEELRNIRWDEIAYIPQSAMDSLDPVETTGDQIREVISAHRPDWSSQHITERVVEVFELVGLDPARMDDYPHQFSGGMRQRVVIAMAFALEPDLIIADEINTGLDVITQDKIFALIEELTGELGSSLVFVSHDIGIIAEMCDTIGVLYGGTLVEYGDIGAVINRPSHPYMMGLKNSFPSIDSDGGHLVSIPGEPPDLSKPEDRCRFVDRCPFAEEACEDGNPPLEMIDGPPGESHFSACIRYEEADELRARSTKIDTWGSTAIDPSLGTDATSNREVVLSDVRKWYPQPRGLLDSIRGTEPMYVKAVDGVSFSIRAGEVFGIAGESGSGKSTLGETLALLERATGGEISFDQRTIDSDVTDMEWFRSTVQFIFQDPYESLNPKFTVRELVREPLKVQAIGDREEQIKRVRRTLERVGLPTSDRFLDKYPHALSGGQRQRIAIARALIPEPELIICDEPTSMLDVSLQADILNLLKTVAKEDGVSILLISHDIAGLHHYCDRIGVLYMGKLIEVDDAKKLVSSPRHPYTKALVNAIPRLDPDQNRTRVQLSGEPRDPIELPDQCIFAQRCPEATDECFEGHPSILETSTGGQVACYHADGYRQVERKS